MQRRPPPVERKSAQEAMRESESRPLDFDPAARSTFLKEAVEKVITMKRGGSSEADIRNTNAELFERYPELAKTLLSSDDLTPLVAMIGMLDRMGSGEISHHNASVAVGKALADRFIPPNMR
jgi:hypothetical protein